MGRRARDGGEGGAGGWGIKTANQVVAFSDSIVLDQFAAYDVLVGEMLNPACFVNDEQLSVLFPV